MASHRPSALRYLASAARFVLPILPACDASRLESAAGRYVVVHWDPSAHSLCGGTLSHIDRSLENIADTYGVSMSNRPSIDIFWVDEAGNAGSCSTPTACSFNFVNGTNITFVDVAIHDHELAHAVRPGGSRRLLPSFFAEGLAVRWEAGPSEASADKDTYIGNLDHDVIRDLLGAQQIPAEYYDEAGFFWAWLEASFGPEALVSFASGVRRSSDVSHIESAFESAFGLSIAQAVEASRGQPFLMSDVHACSAVDAPTLQWEGTGLLVAEETAECNDWNIVNIGRKGGSRIVHLVLPDVLSAYSIEVLGSEPVVARFDRCLGAFRPYEQSLQLSSDGGPSTYWLAGKYALTLGARIATDGTLALPGVRLSTP